MPHFFFFLIVIRAENTASINTVSMGRKGLFIRSGLKIKIKTTTETQLVLLEKMQALISSQVSTIITLVNKCCSQEYPDLEGH